MQVKLLTFALVVAYIGCAQWCTAQDTTSFVSKIKNFPGKLFKKIDNKASDLSAQLDKQTAAYLQRLSKQEAALRRKLYKADSSAAKRFYAGDSGQRYSAWLQKLKNDTSSRPKAGTGEYYPYMDSMKTTLSFLSKNPQYLDQSKIDPAQLQNAMNKLQVLQSKMQDADQIKQYIQQRQDAIRSCLSGYSQLPSGVVSAYSGYNQRYVYYCQQVQQYKDILNDPDKMTAAALQLLNKVPAYTSFFQRNSMLASALNLPGAGNPSLSPGQGMPTRDQVMDAFQGQFPKDAPNLSSMAQGKVAEAQGSAGPSAAVMPSLPGSSGSDLAMPEFTPNQQKTKSFLKRLIVGMDLQTVHSTPFFPATTDIGFSVAYKINDNSDFGIGASYKIGWGQDISHISISGQGASLRSFVDLRIKNTWFATGGMEYNYQQPLQPADIPPLTAWQPSGLIGISKIVPLKTKLVKSAKLQVLWDFLSYQQVPKAQPFVFRVGYSF